MEKKPIPLLKKRTRYSSSESEKDYSGYSDYSDYSDYSKNSLDKEPPKNESRKREHSSSPNVDRKRRRYSSSDYSDVSAWFFFYKLYVFSISLFILIIIIHFNVNHFKYSLFWKVEKWKRRSEYIPLLHRSDAVFCGRYEFRPEFI